MSFVVSVSEIVVVVPVGRCSFGSEDHRSCQHSQGLEECKSSRGQQVEVGREVV